MQVYHDSANCRYRYPPGALRAGAAVYLGIKITDADVEGVYLHLYKESCSLDIPMKSDGPLWYADATVPDEIGAYFYYFRINAAEPVYYCGDAVLHCGAGSLATSPSGAFQITVYDGEFETPEWMRFSVMYQIFPDRFKKGNGVGEGAEHHRALGRRIELHDSWDEDVKYLPGDGEKDYTPNDFFGGNIAGISDSLEYLKELGADVIYLNPVFESASNHRYDTADYMKIDPLLGTNGEFEEFVMRARGLGIRVILDGVFSHTGDDSRYFDKYSRYDGEGAYESETSPYFKWYSFTDYPDEYKCWWGFKSLPEVNENDESWRDFVITGGDSVIKHWLCAGVSGYRLDVADELPDEVIELMRTAAKQQSANNALIGEVWEDATTKKSYGRTRSYAFGRGLDSVMNYPLRNAIIAFLRFEMSSGEFVNFLISQWQNYPAPMYCSLMNLLSSHDTERIMTALALKRDARSFTREQQAKHAYTEQGLAHAGALVRIAAAIVFCLPGMPSVYYGDETGMTGMLDPFNRAPYKVCDEGMREYFRTLSGLRHTHHSLMDGKSSFRYIGEDIAAVLRYASDDAVLLFVNRGGVNHRFVFDMVGTSVCMTEDDKAGICEKKYTAARDMLSGEAVPIDHELMSLELMPFSARIFALE